MEAAADVVAHAAERHAVKRAERNLARLVIASDAVGVQQEQQFRRAREFRRAAKAAVAAVVTLRKGRDACLERVHAGDRRLSAVARPLAERSAAAWSAVAPRSRSTIAPADEGCAAVPASTRGQFPRARPEARPPPLPAGE